MANRFIEVPAESIEMKLMDKGFTPEKQGREVVYTRQGKRADRLTLKVYSSVTEGAATARAKDSDAIRVVLLADVGEGKRPYILYQRKILRVNSVEGVLDRIWEACAEAARESLKVQHVCPRCGAPAYSDSGRCIVKTCREVKPQVPTLQRLQARQAELEEHAGFKFPAGLFPTVAQGIPSLTYNRERTREVIFKPQGPLVMAIFRVKTGNDWIEDKWAV
jgi:hypothetical protein